MAITARDFSQLVERVAPLSCAYHWDNSGMTLYQHDEIKRVYLCLDVNADAIAEAEERGCDTILSHHPLLFSAIKKLCADEPVDALLLKAVRLGLNLYAAHTSYDCAPGGMNEWLAAQLGLAVPKPLIVQQAAQDGSMLSGIGIIGLCETVLEPEELAQKVKQALNLPVVRVAKGKRKIQKVACVGGAGGDFLKAASDAGADAFLTGEIKHNFYAEAAVLGLTLIEAGHYDTEKIFIRAMSEGLQKAQNELKCNIEVICPRECRRPYEFF